MAAPSVVSPVAVPVAAVASQVHQDRRGLPWRHSHRWRHSVQWPGRRVRTSRSVQRCTARWELRSSGPGVLLPPAREFSPRLRPRSSPWKNRLLVTGETSSLPPLVRRRSAPVVSASAAVLPAAEGLVLQVSPCSRVYKRKRPAVTPAFPNCDFRRKFLAVLTTATATSHDAHSSVRDGYRPFACHASTRFRGAAAGAESAPSSTPLSFCRDGQHLLLMLFLVRGGFSRLDLFLQCGE